MPRLHHTREAALLAGQYLELACRDCGACRARRARSWAIRAHHEAQTQTRNSRGVEIPNGAFITLTYNNDHLPADRSLDKRDFQMFVKRLRHSTNTKISYLHCGEYGQKPRDQHIGRPHYHALIYGEDFHEDREVFKQEKNSIVWTSKKLEALWGKGFTTTAPVNFATAAYVAGYVFKKLNASEHYMEYGVWGSGGKAVSVPTPEYITMSRNPGLGSNWFDRYWRDVYPDDLVVVEGKTYRPPPYYDQKLKEMDPCLYDDVIAKRREYTQLQEPTCENELRARGEIFAAEFAQKKERM